MAIRKINKRSIDVNAGGTGSMVLPSGTTAERPASTTEGQLRYNTTTGIYEQYTSVGWKGIDAPPVVTGVSGYINEDDTTDLVVTGSNFSAGATVQFINFSTSSLIKNAPTVTRDSSTQLTVATGNDSSGMTAGTQISIRVTNASGLSATLDNALTVEADPTWSTSSGSLATIYDSQRSSYSSISVSATSSTGTVTYALQSGSLPTGMSLNTSTGAITGTPDAVGSSTTSSFTIRATTDAQGASFTDRSFSITIREPIVTSFTSTGSTSFSVPSGISSVRVLVIAGGGSGGNGDGEAGGGGAGGYIEMPSFPVTPGGSVSVTVGAGATQIDGNPGNKAVGNDGANSVFGTLTAIGGGGGGSYFSNSGRSGGSGGGGGTAGGPGPGTQPAQPGNSGTYGFGNPGGSGGGPSNRTGGGGGGAGGAGGQGASGGGPGQPPGAGGAGGAGRSSDITGSATLRAGGGGGAGGHSVGPAGIGGSGGGGPGGQVGTKAGSPGSTNTGSGGGAGHDTVPYRTGGNGGPGIVIVRY